MKAEIIRDRSLDWFERLMNSPWMDRASWIVIVLAALYFGPVVIAIMIR